MRGNGPIRWIVCALALACTVPAWAQSWPAAKPITMVSPFPPGPPLDLVVRLVSGKLADTLGQAIVVENRAGANGTIGSQMVARAEPDGYTLLAGTVGTHVTAVHLMKALPYDPVQDFTPIAAAVEPVTCLVVNGTLPVKSVAELVDYAKARPGELSYGSSGIGSLFHLMGEQFNRVAGVSINHVPYRGVAPAMQDVIGGHIPLTFISLNNALAPAAEGRVRILAVLEPVRYGRLPDVPSISESYPAFQKPPSWFGFLGPPGLPAPIVTRLNAEIGKALRAPDVVATLEENGYAVMGGSPEDFAAIIRDGIESYGEIIRAAGVPPQ